MADFQKKLSALTASRRIRFERKENDEALQKRIEERSVKNAGLFNSLKKEIKAVCVEVRKELNEVNDDLRVFTNEDSSGVFDKARNFINIYVYPEGFLFQTWGVNAPGLYIECNAIDGTISMSKRVAFYTTNVKCIDNGLNVTTVGIEDIKDILLITIQEILKNTEVPIAQ
jgi:hypothetical protein